MTIEDDIVNQIDRVNALSERAKSLPGNAGEAMAKEMRASVRAAVKAAVRGDIVDKTAALDKLASYQ